MGHETNNDYLSSYPELTRKELISWIGRGFLGINVFWGVIALLVNASAKADVPLASSGRAFPRKIGVGLEPTVVEDFQEGLNGWKVDGTVVTELASHHPKVLGAKGETLLLTFHSSAKETGMALSPEFVIDRPFLNFSIAGGSSDKTAFRVLVDGKVVRTCSGEDSLELRRMTFDVYSLIGKTAQIQIVDQSKDPNYGFLVIDSIEASFIAPTLIQTNFAGLASSIKNQLGLPGIWGSVFSGDGINALYCDGVSRFSPREVALPMMSIPYGSISKVFAGTLACIMISKGILNWNMTAGEIFPEFRGDVPPEALSANIMQFITHHSGIGSNNYPTPDIQDHTKARYEFVKGILKAPRVGVVGEKESYGPGADVVVAMIERITGKTYEDLLKKEICQPFGLTNITVGHPTGKASKNVPFGHNFSHIEENDFDSNAAIKYCASGSIHGTVLDLTTFLGGHIRGENRGLPGIDRAVFQIMHSFPEGSNYALCGASGHYPHFSHNGGIGRGDSIACLFNVDKKIAIAAYTNYAKENTVSYLRDKIYDWFIASFYP